MNSFINSVRAETNLKNAILTSIELYKHSSTAVFNLITDMPYTAEDEQKVLQLAQKSVPPMFKVQVKLTKLTADCDLIKRRLRAFLDERFQFLSATMSDDDILVERVEDGFFVTLYIMTVTNHKDIIDHSLAFLSKNFCGNFYGKCEKSSRSVDDLEVEEMPDNIEYIIPIRTFEIIDFQPIEGTEVPKHAVYLADLNFTAEKVVVCGSVQSVRERTFTKKNGQEKPMFSFVINDGTANFRATYFSRQRSYEKIQTIKEGDWLVMTGKTDSYNGEIRFTANTIDYGKQVPDFKPQKRASKPAPRYYTTVKPQPFVDFAQDNLFDDNAIPDCLKGKEFVVFDLETTGLVSSPSAGNMDKIIEIGAFKIIDGVIKESFTTFIDPQVRLKDEIVQLTGITQNMLYGAPTYEQVMPDFFKFCEGCYLVGHNIASFDFKFVDYYCAQCGYMLERKLFDTLNMAQQQLFLANYKLNTIADKFGIVFNHHRAIDDALTTAKIFIELVKLKKSLPNLV